MLCKSMINQVLHNLVILKFLMLINFQDEKKKTVELICQVFCLLFFSLSHLLFFWSSVFCLRSIDRIIPHGNRICIILYRALSFTWETIKLPQTLSCMAVNQWVRERKRDSSHRVILFGHTGSFKWRNCN